MPAERLIASQLVAMLPCFTPAWNARIAIDALTPNGMATEATLAGAAGPADGASMTNANTKSSEELASNPLIVAGRPRCTSATLCSTPSVLKLRSASSMYIWPVAILERQLHTELHRPGCASVENAPEVRGPQRRTGVAQVHVIERVVGLRAYLDVPGAADREALHEPEVEDVPPGSFDDPQRRVPVLQRRRRRER